LTRELRRETPRETPERTPGETPRETLGETPDSQKPPGFSENHPVFQKTTRFFRKPLGFSKNHSVFLKPLGFFRILCYENTLVSPKLSRKCADTLLVRWKIEMQFIKDVPKTCGIYIYIYI
jgi:hypothetical protein